MNEDIPRHPDYIAARLAIVTEFAFDRKCSAQPLVTPVVSAIPTDTIEDESMSSSDPDSDAQSAMHSDSDVAVSSEDSSNSDSDSDDAADSPPVT